MFKVHEGSSRVCSTHWILAHAWHKGGLRCLWRLCPLVLRVCVYADGCGCGCMAVEYPHLETLIVRLLCGAENRTKQATPPRLPQTLGSPECRFSWACAGRRLRELTSSPAVFRVPSGLTGHPGPACMFSSSSWRLGCEHRDTPTLLPRHCLSVLGIRVRRSGLPGPNWSLNLMAAAACAGQTLGCPPPRSRHPFRRHL